MEGGDPPNAKRLRLDHHYSGPANQHQPPPQQQAPAGRPGLPLFTEPPPPPPPPPPPSQPPSSHPFTPTAPPTTTFPPPAHVLQPPSSRPLLQEPRPHTTDPFTSFPTRPGHGPPMNVSRSYSLDSGALPRAGPPTTLPLSATSEPQRPSLPVLAGPNGLPSHPMDHGMQQPVYSAPPEQQINGAPPNGYPVPNAQEQYQAPAAPPGQAYVHQQVMQYPPPGSYGQMAGGMVHAGYHQFGRVDRVSRKGNRAQQACNNCRARKQKCDEARPCTFCKDSELKCEYKDVPPPKQDRTAQMILDHLNHVRDDLTHIKQEQDEMRDEMKKFVTDVGKKVEDMEQKVNILWEAQQKGGSAVPYPPPVNPVSRSPRGTNDTPAPIPSLSHSSPEIPISSAAAASGPSAPAEHDLMGPPYGTSAGIPPAVPARPIAEDPQEDSIPTLTRGHATPAHKQLTIWSKSMHDFCEGIDGYTEDYPMDIEIERGQLRIYGTGEGRDPHDAAQMASSPVPNPTEESLPEGIWGRGFSPSPPGIPELRQGAGGLNPDGSLKLDEPTVIRLKNSYLDNMYIFHPFLDKGRLNRDVDKFIARYGVPNFELSQGYLGSPETLPPASRKRKRSEAGTPGRSSPCTPQRSIGNAIVLLVLALGMVCEHKEPLPGPVPDASPEAGSPHPSELNSPKSGAVKQSPGTFHPPLASTQSPVPNAVRFGYTSRRASSESPMHLERKDSLLKNMDVIPGLAYFALASDVLGNLHGGNELSHCQAYLLAGLYMGQLGRPIEHWNWISSACRACRILVERNKDALKAHNPDPEKGYLDLIKAVYWSCLQLESDVLAELSDLPPSDITNLEQGVPLPKGVYDDMCLPGHVQEPHLVYYSYQIYLRKILNNVHGMLYSKKKHSKGLGSDNPYGFITQREQEACLENLESWRKILVDNMKWNDDDPPAEDINNARLRGKYYGARYIITRPSVWELIERSPRRSILFTDGSQQSSPALANTNARSSSIHSTPSGAGMEREQSHQSVSTDDVKDKKILELCRIAVESAIKSTTAFDNVPGRPIVTNIFTTAQAQIGNVWFLAAVYRSSLRPLISFETLNALLTRTITFVEKYGAPICAALEFGLRILRNVQKVIANENPQAFQVASAQSSFPAPPPHF